MGKKPDDNENRQSIKKMIHSEMMDRGLVVDKKKKTRSSRDRSRPVSSYLFLELPNSPFLEQGQTHDSARISYIADFFLFQ